MFLGHFQKHIKDKKKKAEILWQRLKVPAVRNAEESSFTQLLPTCKLRDVIQTHIQTPWSTTTDQQPNFGPALTPLATFSCLCKYIKNCCISQKLKAKLVSAGTQKQNLPLNEDRSVGFWRACRGCRGNRLFSFKRRPKEEVGPLFTQQPCCVGSHPADKKLGVAPRTVAVFDMLWNKPTLDKHSWKRGAFSFFSGPPHLGLI